MTDSQRLKPLAGLRVLEYTGGILAAYCGRLFADMGATVTCLERPGGAPLRFAAPLAGRQSLLFEHLTAAKIRGAVDPLVPAGRADLEHLLSMADVFIEDTSPDGPFEGDLHPEAIRTRHPHLVVISLSQFGRTGPYAGWRGNELTSQAIGGLAYVTGKPDQPPLKLAGNPLQFAAAIAGTLGGVAALFDRRRTREGRWVDVSVMEFATGNQELGTLYTWMGLVRKRAFPTMAPAYEYSLYPCRDGWVDLGTTLGDYLPTLAKLIDRPELVDDPRFRDSFGIFMNHEPLAEMIRANFAGRDRDEIFHSAMRARYFCGPVLSPSEVLANEQLVAREFWDRSGGQLRPGTALRFAKGPKGPSWLLPARGNRPLTGIRVIDFTLAYAGPVATRYLAELGADVIHLSSVQYPGRYVESSFWPDNEPGERPWDREGYTTDRYMGKREVTLNLNDERGREVFWKLLATADVFVDNHSPRALRNMRLTFDEVSARVPGIIMVSLSAFGQEGPWADYSATGDVLEAAGGMCDATGYEGGDPERCGMVYLDTVAGTFAALGAVAGLEHRASTGGGCYVDYSMLEGAVATLPEPVLAASAGAAYPGRIGNRHPTEAPHNLYPASGDDEWVAIAARNDAEWTALATALGHPEWLTDARFASAEQRQANAGTLDSFISAKTQARDKWTTARALQAAGVPSAPCLHMDEVMTDPHLWARGTMQFVQHTYGRYAWPHEFPGIIHGADTSIPRPAPALGEHNDEILGGELGLTADELEALRRDDVIGERPLYSGQPTIFDRQAAAGYVGMRGYDPAYGERLAAAERAAGAGNSAYD